MVQKRMCNLGCCIIKQLLVFFYSLLCSVCLLALICIVKKPVFKLLMKFNKEAKPSNDNDYDYDYVQWFWSKIHACTRKCTLNKCIKSHVCGYDNRKVHNRIAYYTNMTRFTSNYDSVLWTLCSANTSESHVFFDVYASYFDYLWICFKLNDNYHYRKMLSATHFCDNTRCDQII